MPHHPHEGAETRVAPPDAFATLGDETRLAILHVLGDAAKPLSFSTLQDRVGYKTASNFSYHLDQLADHFIQKTDAGYELRQPGRRVVEAVLAGTVTDTPTIEPTVIDEACQYCGAPVEVSYRDEWVTLACTNCAGVYGDSVGDADRQRLGALPLPPAGVIDRSPETVLQAAYTWGGLDILGIANDVCPRCAGTIEKSVTVCEDHDATSGRCDACDRRYAVQVTAQCRNCIYDQEGAIIIALIGTTEFLAYCTTHEINPVAPSSQAVWDSAIGDYDETIHSLDPFEATFSFSIDGEELTLTVDDDFQILDATTTDSP